MEKDQTNTMSDRDPKEILEETIQNRWNHLKKGFQLIIETKYQIALFLLWLASFIILNYMITSETIDLISVEGGFLLFSFGVRFFFLFLALWLYRDGSRMEEGSAPEKGNLLHKRSLQLLTPVLIVVFAFGEIVLFGIGYYLGFFFYLVEIILLFSVLANVIVPYCDERWDLSAKKIHPGRIMLIIALVLIFSLYIPLYSFDQATMEFSITFFSLLYFILGFIAFFVFYFLVLWRRNNPYYHHLKSYLFYLLPLMFLFTFYYNLLMVFSAQIEILKQLFDGVQFFIIVLLFVYDMGKTANEEREESQRVPYHQILLLFAISLYIAGFETQTSFSAEMAGGLTELRSYFILFLLGISVIVALLFLGKQLSNTYEIDDFSYHKLIFGGFFPPDNEEAVKVEEEEEGGTVPPLEGGQNEDGPPVDLSCASKCEQCGYIGALDQRFCGKCGAPLETHPETPRKSNKYRICYLCIVLFIIYFIYLTVRVNI